MAVIGVTGAVPVTMLQLLRARCSDGQLARCGPPEATQLRALAMHWRPLTVRDYLLALPADLVLGALSLVAAMASAAALPR